MVIRVVFIGSGGQGEARKSALCAVVKIRRRHYIWCPAYAQATTGSVPTSFVSFLQRPQIILGDVVVAHFFIF
jgi:hypothetical protein